MRLLYYKYYKKLNRGFTEQEFRNECEKMAGVPLTEVFEYASTVKPPDYPKYFAYGGLAVDTATKVVSESWAGLNVRQQGDTLRINTVAYKSPAWDKGIRGRTVILTVDGTPATKDILFKAFETKNTGDSLTLGLLKNGEKKDITIVLGRLREKTFKITPLPNPDQLQSAIFKSWTEGK
jgi:predicted metalloprotease with PDZ domain